MERMFGLCLGIGLVLFVLYQLACETSMLSRLIRKGAEKRDVGRILLLGLLFGHVLTAKANSYVILIYAFFMLLVPFLEEDRRGEAPAFKDLCLDCAGSLCVPGTPAPGGFYSLRL